MTILMQVTAAILWGLIWFALGYLVASNTGRRND